DPPAGAGGAGPDGLGQRRPARSGLLASAEGAGRGPGRLEGPRPVLARLMRWPRRCCCRRPVHFGRLTATPDPSPCRPRRGSSTPSPNKTRWRRSGGPEPFPLLAHQTGPNSHPDETRRGDTTRPCRATALEVAPATVRADLRGKRWVSARHL